MSSSTVGCSVDTADGGRRADLQSRRSRFGLLPTDDRGMMEDLRGASGAPFFT